MKYLVLCGCGHSLERHGDEGCAGPDAGPLRPCACKKDQREALEVAIDDARSRPWDAARGVSAPSS